jgi:hypothetical protein
MLPSRSCTEPQHFSCEAEIGDKHETGKQKIFIAFLNFNPRG